MDLIATRAFERAELRKKEGERFACDDKDVADHLVRIAGVARKATAEDDRPAPPAEIPAS